MLLDLGMPHMDGFEVARRIRAMPRGRNLMLVALTGWGQPEERRRTTEAGFDDHLTKPVDGERLAAILASDGSGGTLSIETEALQFGRDGFVGPAESPAETRIR